MSDGVTITLAMTLKPEIVDAFCGGVQEMLKDTANFPGFRSIVIHRNKDTPNQVLFVENWDSEEAYNGYIAWRTQRGDMDNMAAMLEAPPQLAVWPSVVARA